MESLHSEDARVARLAEYLARLAAGETTRESHDRYLDVLGDATPFEANAAIDAVLSGAEDIGRYKAPVARFVRALASALDALPLPAYSEGSLLARLESENDRLGAALGELQKRAIAVRAGSAPLTNVTDCAAALTLLEEHYATLQNSLFPLFEQATAKHSCVKLMWEIQNDVLAARKRLCDEGRIAQKSPGGPVSGLRGDGAGETGKARFWKLFGDFFLNAAALIYRERRILFPIAWRTISPAAWDRTEQAIPARDTGFSSATGSLAQGELEAIFRLLPVDFSFIGADDRVKFYSDPPHRIFPRTPAVIGRLVQNCHPPKSVAAVEAILTSFKDGSRDSAEFWLTVKDRFVHIQYFAVRDSERRYLGTLEVSQDASHLRSLSGEKRLL